MSVLFVGISGPDYRDIELSGRRGRQKFVDVRSIGSWLFVDAGDHDDRQRRGLQLQLEAELFVDGREDGDAVRILGNLVGPLMSKS